jgi:hypothetical protein
MHQTTTAEADLEWFFRLSSADTGFHAQAYEGNGGRVFDDAASWDLHKRLHQPRHREIIRRYQRVRASLGALPDGIASFLRLAFEPRGFPFSTWDLERQVLAACRRRSSNVHVLSVLLSDDGAIAARRNREHPQTPDSWTARLLFVESTVRAAHGRDDRLPLWFKRAISDVAEAVAHAVKAFEAIRAQRLAWEAEERQQQRNARRLELERLYGLAPIVASSPESR